MAVEPSDERVEHRPMRACGRTVQAPQRKPMRVRKTQEAVSLLHGHTHVVFPRAQLRGRQRRLEKDQAG